MLGEKRRSIYKYPYPEKFDIEEKFMYFNKVKKVLKKVRERKDGTIIYEGAGRKWFTRNGVCYTIRNLK